MNQLRFLPLIALSVAVLALAGCGGPAATGTPGATSAATSTPASTPGTTPAGGTSTVNVTVQEFAVVPETTSAPAGDITFAVTNEGPDDVHEFVVIQTDLAPEDLPTDDTGAVDEEGDGINVIDELEAIDVGSTAELAVTLEPGAYVLICNVFDAAEDEAHYEMGMYTAFTVE